MISSLATAAKIHFVFAPNFGNDTHQRFRRNWIRPRHYSVQQDPFSTISQVSLAHATQIGQNVAITADASNSVTLKNTKLSTLRSHDFHFA